LTFHETKLIVDFVTIVIKDLDDSRIFVWSFKRWSFLTGTLNHKEQHQLLVFMFKVNGVKLVRHLTFDFKLRLRFDLRSLMHIISFMSWFKSLSLRWPFFIDFLGTVFRLPIRVNYVSELRQNHMRPFDFRNLFSWLACFFGFSLRADYVMFQLEMSIVVAFIMASIVTMITLKSISSQISSFLSLLVFNRSLILKVISIEKISF
jgi:hypothetical protein